MYDSMKIIVLCQCGLSSADGEAGCEDRARVEGAFTSILTRLAPEPRSAWWGRGPEGQAGRG